MKTYTKAEVAEVIRDVLRGKVDVESVEHIGKTDFSLCIATVGAEEMPDIPAPSYKRFLKTLADVLSQRFDSDVRILSSDDKLEYLESKSAHYWTRHLIIALAHIRLRETTGMTK